jgi:hypothetical protein
MTGATSKRIPARYRCRATDRGAAASNPRCSEGVTAPKLEAAVLAQIERVVEIVASNDPAFQADLRRAWHTIQRPEADAELSIAVTVKNLAAVATKARERLKRAALLLVDGDIDKRDYEQVRAQAQADLEAAEAEIERLQLSSKPETARLPAFDDVLCEAGNWAAVLRGGDTIAQREVLALLVDRIEPIRVSHGKFDAAIEWTPLGEALRSAASALGNESA